ncbi:MAG: DUF4231 domain-containing protein [Planctomycetota bacterium]
MSEIKDYIEIRLKGIVGDKDFDDLPKPDQAKYVGSGQIPYFSNAATREQNKGRILQDVQIAAAAATPVLIGAAEIFQETNFGTLLRVLALVAAAATAFVTGTLSVRKHWQLGVNYRTREQALISQLYYWEMDAGDYSAARLKDSGKDKDMLLVETCEGIIGDDVEYWSSAMKDASSRLKGAS